MRDLSLLGIFAHPDDEQLVTGVFARAAAGGIRTGLICATRGEAGQIHPDADATPETLGQVREAELRAACVVAGIKYLWFLDYRDSGWMGSPENDDPRNFHNADEEEALGKIVRIIREFKPTVIITFDDAGGYGHYDHIKAHRLTVEAFRAAAEASRFPEAGEPWQAARLYYSGFSRSVARQFANLAREMAPQSDFASLDLERLGIPDEEITNSIDVREWVPLKMQSLAQHRTQRSDQDLFGKLPQDVIEQVRGIEYYVLAAGLPLPNTPDARGDLFAGLREV